MTKRIQTLAFTAGMMLAAVPVAAHADVVAYSGSGDKHVFVESGADAKTYYVEFTGINSPWAGKPIKTAKTTTPSGDRYAFSYDVHLSTGTVTRSYQILLSADPTLVNGTVTPVVELYYSGGPRDGTQFAEDAGLTKSSQGISLAKQYDSAPFKPDVE